MKCVSKAGLFDEYLITDPPEDNPWLLVIEILDVCRKVLCCRKRIVWARERQRSAIGLRDKAVDVK